MKKINHMMDITVNFNEILERIIELRKKIEAESKVSYESQDTRHVALDAIQQDISACVMLITALNSLANIFTNKKNNTFREEFLKSVGSIKDLEQTENIMLNYLRFSILVLVHFKIDNLFQNLLNELNIHFNRGFWNLCNTLIDKISVNQKEDKKEKLILLSYLRNSFHNNGIHRGRSLTKTLNNLNYSFENGYVVECASWDHIIKAISANIDVLSEILLSKEIKSLNHEIEDKYAASVDRP